MVLKALSLIGIALAHAWIISAQSAGPAAPSNLPVRAHFRASTTISPPPMPAVVTGAPYSGVSIGESVRTLADGTRIIRGGRVRMYRDSKGRTRWERSVLDDPDAPFNPLLIEIDDPLSGVAYVLDTEGKVAHRIALVTPPPPVVIPRDPAMIPASKREQLGSRVIQGVVAQGERITTTFPVGSRGNDRPLTNVREIWRSPELQLALLEMYELGESSSRGSAAFESLNRLEPDPLLFAPPGEYRIIEERGEFTISYP